MIERYIGETKRLYSVLDTRLADRAYLAGDFSIADIAHWCWVRVHGAIDISLEEFPNLGRWHDVLAARPGFAKGVLVPDQEHF